MFGVVVQREERNERILFVDHPASCDFLLVASREERLSARLRSLSRQCQSLAGEILL